MRQDQDHWRTVVRGMLALAAEPSSANVNGDLAGLAYPDLRASREVIWRRSEESLFLAVGKLVDSRVQSAVRAALLEHNLVSDEDAAESEG